MPKTPAQVVALLEEMAQLMRLNDENPFKVRAFEKASQALGAQGDLNERARAGTLTEIAGVGKSIAEVLTDFLVKGQTTARDELLAAIPAGLMELSRVPGLGPKKARQVIEELEIHSVAELEYACRENRLLKLKGFGEKVQTKIFEGIQLLNSARGKARIDEAFPLAERLLKVLLSTVNESRHPAGGTLRVSETGALRRRLEILSELSFLIETPPGERATADVKAKAQAVVERFVTDTNSPLKVVLDYARPERFGFELARTTSTDENWRALGAPDPFDAPDEAAFFARLSLPIIPPEARETAESVAMARQGLLSQLLPWDGIQGVFHNHTTRSDGAASLEEMVVAAKTMGFRYFGISDHSQSAFYAQGLKVPTLLEQEREVREVQAKHPEIKIFWGIESDILGDGSLDYEPAVLKKFDFVVASVHSRFQMDRATMTERIVTAIRNPHTRFLGHATGRLLLGRKGYEVDMERVIREAAENDVAIEINANPARLDIDWRWGAELRRHGTKVSVNPDAHETAGLQDTIFGIAVARKALLPASLVVNSRSVDEVAKWLRRG